MNTQRVQTYKTTISKILGDPAQVRLHSTRVESTGKIRIKITMEGSLASQETLELKTWCEGLGRGVVTVREADKNVRWFMNKLCTEVTFTKH